VFTVRALNHCCYARTKVATDGHPNPLRMARRVYDADAFMYYPGRLVQAPIVMLSGLVAGDWIWTDVRDALVAAGYPCLTMRDPIAMTHSSIDAAAFELGEALDQFAIQRATILGASLGSAVALAYAVDNAHRVDRLVLSGAPAMGGRNLGIASFGKLTRTIAFDVARGLFHDRSRIADEQIEHAFRLFLDRRHLANMIRLLREAQSLDVKIMLRKLEVSTLFVWGDDDNVSDCDDWARLSSYVKDATFVRVASCGHLPMVEQPERFTSALLHHMGRRARSVTAAAI
jgi:2-hydroxy-6-oxonona-2,4-dienedioate hydrolase